MIPTIVIVDYEWNISGYSSSGIPPMELPSGKRLLITMENHQTHSRNGNSQ